MKQPKVARKSAAQAAAGKKFAAAGQAAQAAKRAAYAKSHHGAKLPRTKAQTQAAMKWAAAGKASQAARKQGKAPPKKAAAIAVPGTVPGTAWPLGGNDVAATCAPAAVASHLLAFTGLTMADGEIALLHALAGGEDGATVADVLEVLREAPWLVAGARVASFGRADEDAVTAGLVIVSRLGGARHAVLSHPQGMVSWGGVRAWEGVPEEAWVIEWEAREGSQ